MTETGSNRMETRWNETYQMMTQHPSVATQQFLDDFHRAMSDLINGKAEQVCLNRQNDQGPIRVEWTPVTVGQRDRWPGTGTG
ncbi:MAG: hypothetical protein M3Z66_00340 [Chloroflexota bacterium]|nr:hypothetical protein [Chloroflexota bacterium]